MNQDNYINVLNDSKNTLISSKFFLSSEKFKENNIEIIRTMENLIKQIDLKLKTECKHEYIEDLVDLSPEKSQVICYCNKCWCTFEKPN